MADPEIDWKSRLGSYGLIFDTPSRSWADGVPLGNGTIGTLVYEEMGVHPTWVINRNDVWDYRHPEFKRHPIEKIREIARSGVDYKKEMSKESPGDSNKYPCPKTCAQLRIRFGESTLSSPGHRISKRLDLYEATLFSALDKHLSHPRITSFVDEQDVLAISVRDVSVMTAFQNKVELFRKPDALMTPAKLHAEGDTIWLEQDLYGGLCFVVMAMIVPTGKAAYQAEFRKTIQRMWWKYAKPDKTVNSKSEGEYSIAGVKGDFDVYLTVVTGKKTDDLYQQARSKLIIAAKSGMEKLHAAHKHWWAKYWDAGSCVQWDTPFLDQLWYACQYDLGSTMRGIPTPALCGLWYGPTDEPSQVLPWMGAYTNDYNAQLPIMPLFRLNRPELAEPMFRTLYTQLQQAKRNARELYGISGAYYPLHCDPTGQDSTNGPYRLVQNSGPYWGVFLWWHWEYTKDIDFLKNVSYPIMREVSIFFANYMQWHGDEQRYHLEASQNPELMYIKYPDPVDTLVLLKYTLNATISAAEILGLDKKWRSKWRHLLEHYPDYPTSGDEILPLRGMPKGHINHARTMAGLFPTGEFDPQVAPEWLDRCVHEIEKMRTWGGTYACNGGRSYIWPQATYHCGLPLCWLGRKNDAWVYLEDIIKSSVKPSGLVSIMGASLVNSELSEKNIQSIPDEKLLHDLGKGRLKLAELTCGQILGEATEFAECHEQLIPGNEGPSAVLLMMGEMLLQSHNGILRFFAGLPDKKDVSFRNLRVQGPALVSSARRNGKVRFIKIKALKAVAWKIVNPFGDGNVYLYCDGCTRKIALKKGEFFEISLGKNQEVILARNIREASNLDRYFDRKPESPHARKMSFGGKGICWLGKPHASEYYKSFEKINL